MENDKKYLTAKELAERWPVNINTLSNWRWRGYGPGYTVFGSTIGYPIDEVEAFEKAHFKEGGRDAYHAILS